MFKEEFLVRLFTPSEDAAEEEARLSEIAMLPGYYLEREVHFMEVHGELHHSNPSRHGTWACDCEVWSLHQEIRAERMQLQEMKRLATVPQVTGAPV